MRGMIARMKAQTLILCQLCRTSGGGSGEGHHLGMEALEVGDAKVKQRWPQG